MRKELFDDILDATMYPAAVCPRVLPDGHRFMQDIDPKHTSYCAQEWMEDNPS